MTYKYPDVVAAARAAQRSGRACVIDAEIVPVASPPIAAGAAGAEGAEGAAGGAAGAAGGAAGAAGAGVTVRAFNHLATRKRRDVTVDNAVSSERHERHTVHSAHCTRHTAHCALHTVHCTGVNACTARNTTVCTLYTLHTCHTPPQPGSGSVHSHCGCEPLPGSGTVVQPRLYTVAGSITCGCSLCCIHAVAGEQQHGSAAGPLRHAPAGRRGATALQPPCNRM